MNEKEIELAMEGLFRGASRVRARKNAKRVFSDLNERIAEQRWEEKKRQFKVA